MPQFFSENKAEACHFPAFDSVTLTGLVTQESLRFTYHINNDIQLFYYL